jgi:HTH-type transcriptional regulator / antitoxin HipB
MESEIEKVIRSPSDMGPLIKALRKYRNLTQLQLSKMTGIKQQNISAIESGTQQPSLKTVFAILSTLNLELRVHQRIQRLRGYAPGKET